MKESWEKAWDEAKPEERRRCQRWGTPTGWNPKTKSGKWARRLKGERCQCGTCGHFFSEGKAFDAHRTGPFGKPGTPSKRRCLTLAEMANAGFGRNENFYLTKDGPRTSLTAPQSDDLFSGIPQGRVRGNNRYRDH